MWQRSYRGLEGVEEWFDEVQRIWDEFAIEPDEISAIDDERLLVKAHWKGRAIAGGSEVGGPSVGVIAFRGDRVVLVDFYLNEETALASLEG